MANRRGGCGCFTILLALLVLLTGLVAGALYKLISPALPPGGLVALTPLGSTTYSPPDVPNELSGVTLPTPDPAFLVADLPGLDHPSNPQGQQMFEQLKAIGLPVTFTTIEEGASGPVLAIDLDYAALSVGSTSGGLAESLSALVQMGKSSQLNFSGLHDVTVTVGDAKGRVLYAASAPVGSIEAFRSNEIDRLAFIKSIGFKGVDRIAIIQNALQAGL